jgi:hypothetical protein
MDLTVQPLPDTNGANVGSVDGNYVKDLDSLAQDWAAHRGAGLELRHKTGKVLNDQFGVPGETRQKRGDHTLKEAAEKLKTSQAEISRMRWLAHHFKSVEDLNDQHPNATTWTAVKEILSDLSPRSDGKGKASPESAAKSSGQKESATAKFPEIKKTFANLSSNLPAVTKELSEDEKKELLEKFRDLVKAFEECLNIRVSVEVKPVESVSPMPSIDAGL